MSNCISTGELSKTLPIGKKFYRYDVINCLPDDWSINYHSIEYSPKRGWKNQCGAFFFFDNKTVALSVFAASKIKRRKTEGIITSCSTIKSLNLLDLSIYDSPSQMLCDLYKHGINVFGKGFFRYAEDTSNDALIDEIKEAFDKINYSKDATPSEISSNISQCTKINNFFNFFKIPECRCRYIGQLFTDFGNGPIFKQLLLNFGFDGYCFREEKDSLTYCIFDSNVLSPPKHHKTTKPNFSNDNQEETTDNYMKSELINTENISEDIQCKHLTVENEGYGVKPHYKCDINNHKHSDKFLIMKEKYEKYTFQLDQSQKENCGAPKHHTPNGECLFKQNKDIDITICPCYEV